MRTERRPRGSGRGGRRQGRGERGRGGGGGGDGGGEEMGQEEGKEEARGYGSELHGGGLGFPSVYRQLRRLPASTETHKDREGEAEETGIRGRSIYFFPLRRGRRKAGRERSEMERRREARGKRASQLRTEVQRVGYSFMTLNRRHLYPFCCWVEVGDGWKWDRVKPKF